MERGNFIGLIVVQKIWRNKSAFFEHKIFGNFLFSF